MKGVIDTSVLIQRQSGEPYALPDELAVSAATIAELYVGVLLAEDPLETALRLAALTRVEAEFEMLPIDRAVAQRYGAIVAAARQRGLRPKPMDALIAATALAHGVPVYTADEGFASLPLVEVVKV